MPRCSAVKPDGTPCERIVGASQNHCYAHDPAYAGQRQRAASKAAKSKPNRDLLKIKGLLRELYGDVLRGGVEPKVAAVAGQIANTQLRAIELARRIREQDELEERIDELEGLLNEAEQGAHARW